MIVTHCDFSAASAIDICFDKVWLLDVDIYFYDYSNNLVLKIKSVYLVTIGVSMCPIQIMIDIILQADKVITMIAFDEIRVTL